MPQLQGWIVEDQKREREREFIHLVFATKILVSRSVLAHSGSDAFAKCFPSPAAKIVEHEYLAFGRKISPWTCTINDPPLFLLNRWIRTPLSIRRRVGESELPFSLEVKLRGNGSWNGERKEKRGWISVRRDAGNEATVSERFSWSCTWLNFGISNLAIFRV